MLIKSIVNIVFHLLKQNLVSLLKSKLHNLCQLQKYLIIDEYFSPIKIANAAILNKGIICIFISKIRLNVKDSMINFIV
jgi:hypothetical protein